MSAPDLGPWRSQLQELHPIWHEHAGPWIPRLSAALGPIRRIARPDPNGEPDGFDGFSRRGSWERLAMTEWALADAAPNAFLQRAVDRELLFLQLSRREPAQSTRTVVLLDCGPGQLGAPRLAHLAILIVLAARAEAAGGELHWGVLTQPSSMQQGVEHPALCHWKDVHTLADVDEQHVQAWAHSLDGATGFVIGAPENIARCQALGLEPICVGEGSNALELDLPRTRKHLVLPLPGRAEQRRMLRLPSRPLVIRSSDTGARSIRMHGAGTALIVRHGSKFSAWPIPTTARKGLRSKGWVDLPEQSIPVATAWRRGKLLLLWAQEGSFGLSRLRETDSVWRRAPSTAPMPDGFVLPEANGVGAMHLLPATMRPSNTERAALLVRDATAALWCLDFHRSRADLVDTTSSLVVHEQAISWVSADPTRLVVLQPVAKGNQALPALSDYFRKSVPLPAQDRPVMLTGARFNGTSPLIAIPRHGQWAVGRLGSGCHLDPIDTLSDMGLRVIGCMGPPAALVLLEDDLQTVVLRTKTEMRTLTHTEATVVDAHLAPSTTHQRANRSPVLALRLATGNTHFFNMKGHELYILTADETS
jgi:hypothetical protein